jgi:hypothetical protein
VACLVGSSAFAATFDPANVVSNDNFRAYDSMNQADIQAFLKSSPVLASYQATDYATGKKALASTIIYNASQKFHISPKIFLALLQKEQSLLTRSKSGLVTGPTATLDWALGMGCPDSYGDLAKHTGCYATGCHGKQPSIKRYPEYRGFGRQIYAAAQSLDAYGEKGKSRPGWHHKTAVGTESAWVVGTVFKGLYTPTGTLNLAIKNLATFKLYTYNPSIGAKTPYGDLSAQAGKSWMSGNANYWLIYRKYFGDTQANPRIRPIYRIRDVKNGAFIYTASPAERYNLSRSSRYRVEKVAFSWDTSNTANKIPVHRFMNRKTRGYVFTSSPSLYAHYTSAALKPKWRYEGVAFRVSSKVASATPVYQFNNRKTGLPFLTSSVSDKNTYLSATNKKKWVYKGIAFYLAP